MKYYIISTGRGSGAIFTDKSEAEAFQANHAGSVYSVSDRLPSEIPPKGAASKPAPTQKSRPATTKGSSEIEIYTDGSALGNPGPGGYGVVMQKDGETIELSQGYRHTTNNRMEMLAVITALEELDGLERPVKIYSDSQYTINGIVKGWAKGWRSRGWKKSDGKPALNIDLWKRLLGLVEKMDVSFQWVKGHAGNPLNERADVLANRAAQGRSLLEDAGYKG